MKRMLSKRDENDYYDVKATCGRERAFLIAKASFRRRALHVPN